MKFYTNYTERPKFVDRFNSGVQKVEKAGYRPAYLEIANMIASGERFEKARQFDYQNEQEIETKVNHVDVFNKDKFELIDEGRNIRASLGKALDEEKRKAVENQRAIEKQAIIDEYLKSKADIAEAPTKAE